MMNLIEHVHFTMTILEEQRQKSLKGATIIYRNIFSKITPKFLFRHHINISENRVYPDSNAEHICCWDKEYVDNEIIHWLNNNTSKGYFIVLFENPLSEFHENETRERICFRNKQDAATFKMYFK